MRKAYRIKNSPIDRKWETLVKKAINNYKSLTRRERIWFNIRVLIDSINGGGLISYYYNSGADNVYDLIDDLEYLKLYNISRIVKNHNDLLFNGSKVPSDIDKRNEYIHNLNDLTNDKLEDLEVEISNLLYLLEKKLITFLIEEELIDFVHNDIYKLVRLSILAIISIIVVILGSKDAIQSTKLYNQIDLENEFIFEIQDKYNKKESGKNFPDLNFYGEIENTKKQAEIRVSKGDYDENQIGDKIKVYKSPSNKYMTEYEIQNQMIIHIGKNGYSFVFIPVFVFTLIGLTCIIYILKNIVFK